MDWLGWRGIAMLGILPLAVLLVWRFVPESVLWLAAKGRVEAARAEAAQYLRLPLDCVPRRPRCRQPCRARRSTNSTPIPGCSGRHY
jgi:hypothetical protein